MNSHETVIGNSVETPSRYVKMLAENLTVKFPLALLM